MGENYFSHLVSETSSRVWVNNPTIEEVGLALAEGAVGCTTNPAYGGGLLKRAPNDIKPTVAEVIHALPEASVAEVVGFVQRKESRRADCELDARAKACLSASTSLMLEEGGRDENCVTRPAQSRWADCHSDSRGFDRMSAMRTM